MELNENHTPSPPPDLDYILKEVRLGNYTRQGVIGLSDAARPYFDAGYRLLLAYQHELASHFFHHCLELSPDAALAHGLIALCHAPNYNFKGESYYISTYDEEEVNVADTECAFPSQVLADRHSALGVHKSDQRLKNEKKMRKKGGDGRNSDSDRNRLMVVESQLLAAIRILTGQPGIHSSLSEEVVGRPYADAMRKIHHKYPTDLDIAHLFCESLMVLNAWKLFEYPSGRPLSPDVDEIGATLQASLATAATVVDTFPPQHPGLLHMYVHWSEMSADPRPCVALRTAMPDAGHLLHMPSHVDVLLGDYVSCVQSNLDAMRADRHMMELAPTTAGPSSFYFGYIVHDYHMAVYGAILGGMEAKALEVANELGKLLPESLFASIPATVGYLEAYATIDVEVLVRFGRWTEILGLEFPSDRKLMLSRTAELLFARSLALAFTGEVEAAGKEADRYDSFVTENAEEAQNRILHNNTVFSLWQVNGAMLRGELLYKQGHHVKAFATLRRAVTMQDSLHYDEPWGKMQPIRHALGGLLLEQGELEEAIAVLKQDLVYHPQNPWALVGLIRARRAQNCCNNEAEIKILKSQLDQQRSAEWADFEISVACECCRKGRDGGLLEN